MFEYRRMLDPLDDATIHRLVFETFGLRRYTQDSPIQPDVWVWFLKLAAAGRLDERISLILTPKETPGKDGRPPGSAAQLAECIRSQILGRSRNQEPIRKDETKIAPEKSLRPYKVAATARNVVLEANFEDVLRYLLPITAWWADQVDERFRHLETLGTALSTLARQRTPIRQALIKLDDTEFFRFAALAAIIWMISKEGSSDPAAVTVMIHSISPPRPKDDLDRLLKGRPRETSVRDIAQLWQSYIDVATQTFAREGAPTGDAYGPAAGNAASVDAEVRIWSIQRNRVARREAVAAQAQRKRPALLRLSQETVKADAAIKLFSISTADLAWAVVDTGIDANHQAFAFEMIDEGGKKKKSTRVVATLDFTELRKLLAEEFDIDQLVKTFPWNPRTDPISPVDRKKRLLTTIDSIRRRNVNGRELDWSLLEPLVRREPKDAPSPSDPHGTHVAGILAADLMNGVTGDDEPFVGICPDIRLYDLRVFGEDDNGEAVGGDEFTILAALDYIAWVNRDPERPAVHGVNLSLSIQHEVDAHACGHTPVCDACNRLVSSGTVVVAAAGNAGFDHNQDKATLGTGYRGTSITDPGNAELVITVGATHRSEPHTYGVSYFSSRGPTGDGRQKPDLVAPGEKIRSTVPGQKMLVKDGTSMAAPHVSGVCALLMARHREFIGEPMRIKGILMKTATDLGRERSFQGAGLVDALRALQAV